MPRAPRIQFEGAQYHVMCRGDRREPIFTGDADHGLFLKTLGEACERTGWRVHAFVLMRNHYHFLLETPSANLVAGMRWVQTTYTARYNARHGLSGHLFQGRYKALVVDPEEPEHARRVADYIHLNPIRAGLVAEEEELAKLPWCSYSVNACGKGKPEWLHCELICGELGMRSDLASGRRRFRRYMSGLIGVEKEQSEEQADVSGAETSRGWVLGGEAFREKMEALASAVIGRSRRESFDGEPARRCDERAAESLLLRALAALELNAQQLQALRKNDPRKQAVAWLLKKRALVPNRWVCENLRMGHWSNLNRAWHAMERPATTERKRLHKKMMKCTD